MARRPWRRPRRVSAPILRKSTPQMVMNFSSRRRRGQCAGASGRRVNGLSSISGVAADFDPLLPGLIQRKVARGDLQHDEGGRPWTRTQGRAGAALRHGTCLPKSAAKGLDLVATGDMGIGNTTPRPRAIVRRAGPGSRLPRVTGRGNGALGRYRFEPED